jgi:uncharacterized protein (AIM24 family)
MTNPMTQDLIIQHHQQQGRRLGVEQFPLIEASLGENRILIYQLINQTSISYVAEIVKKDEDLQTLVLPGIISLIQPFSKLTLEHYGLRESGVSGFIKSQVTGESFVMTELKGTGIARTGTSTNLIGPVHFQNTKLSIPNNNIAYFLAMLGNFELSSPIKGKMNIPVAYTEVKCTNALVLMEQDTFYEVEVLPGHSVEAEAGEIVFWMGDLAVEEEKEGSEGNLVKFNGTGRIYLSLGS